MGAVERFGKDPRRTGFSYAPGAGKEKGVGNPVSINGISQGLTDMLLADKILKRLGTPFSRKDEI